MACDRPVEPGMLKARRSPEIKGQGPLIEAPAWTGVTDPAAFIERYLAGEPTDDRLWRVLAALRRGATVDAVHEATPIDRWFLPKLPGILRFPPAHPHPKPPNPPPLPPPNPLA